LVTPEDTQVVSIHPKMIEMKVEEFMTKEVPVRIQFIKSYNRNLKVKEVLFKPQKVKIFGYKSRIQSINSVAAVEPVDRSKITETTTLKIDLKKREEILKFEDAESVEVTIVVERHDQRK
jgi:YbbR domain-containing protein